jgi:predicted transcriptional regulator
MKAYTVQIDDTLADSLSAAAAERSTSVEALIVSAAAEMAFELGEPLSAEQLARVEAGLAAEREGRVVSQDIADARLAARRQR